MGAVPLRRVRRAVRAGPSLQHMCAKKFENFISHVTSLFWRSSSSAAGARSATSTVFGVRVRKEFEYREFFSATPKGLEFEYARSSSTKSSLSAARMVSTVSSRPYWPVLCVSCLCAGCVRCQVELRLVPWYCRIMKFEGSLERLQNLQSCQMYNDSDGTVSPCCSAEIRMCAPCSILAETIANLSTSKICMGSARVFCGFQALTTEVYISVYSYLCRLVASVVRPWAV